MKAKFQLLPALSPDEFAALKADIAKRGVLVPVEYDEHEAILDGHHRVRACEELGLAQWPRVVRRGLSAAEKRTHVRRLNLARRHLDGQQKRELIRQQWRETPEAPIDAVAQNLGV